MNVSVISVPSIPEAQRRALATVAAMACPDEAAWPHGLVTIGADLDQLLQPSSLVALFWCDRGETPSLIGSAALHEYIRRRVPVLVLLRSRADAQAVADALRARAAA